MFKYLASVEDSASPFKEERTRYERLCIWFLWYMFGNRRSKEIACRMAEGIGNRAWLDKGYSIRKRGEI